MAALSIVGVSACGDENRSVSGPGYEVTLPEGWEDAGEISDEVGNEAEAQIADRLGNQDVSLTLDSTWVRSSESGFRTNANVFRQGLPPGLSLAAYADLSLRRAGKYIPHARFDRMPYERNVAGHPGLATDYSGRPHGSRLRFRTVSVEAGGVVYNVTLTALPGRWDEAATEFDEILDSWVFTE